MAITILLADDNQAFVDVRAAFLRNAGYNVIEADSPSKAENVLRKMHVHLAILDIRMVKEDDENDISGIQLAKNPDFRSIPKIMLTAYPNYQTVTEIFDQNPDEMPPFVQYIAKKEGPKTMLDIVEQVIKKYVRINQKLEIHWNPKRPLSFPGLVGMIEPAAPPDQLSVRVSELEDLIRTLFYQFDQVTILQQLWTRKERLALEILTYSQAGEEQFVVVCGTVKTMREELEHYQKLSARLQQTGGLSTLRPAEGVHYALRGRTLPGRQAPGEEIKTLADFYQARPSQVKTVVENLLKKTLAPWLQNERSYAAETLAQACCEKFSLKPETISPEAFHQKLVDLGREFVLRGLAEVSLVDGRVGVRFPGGRVVRVKEPAGLLYDATLTEGIDVLCHRSPGGIDAETILVDPAGNTWFSDFAEVGTAPQWDGFVSLECSLRFRFADLSDLLGLYDMEKTLLTIKKLGDVPPIDSIDADHRRLAGVLQTIRAQAGVLTGEPALPYLACLYFYAVAPLATFDKTQKYSYNEIQLFLYRLLLAGLLAEKIDALNGTPVQAEIVPLAVQPLVIKEASREVTIGSNPVDLTKTEYKLLLYFYKHAGKVCLRDDITLDVFTEKGEELLDAESQINTYVGRIRKAIEPDPKNPVYLLTERGLGFKLVTHQ